MTRLPSIGVTKIARKNDLSGKQDDNGLPFIMTRIQSIGVTKITTTDYLP